MSLRARLTLLYSMSLGGILLIFGVLIYFSVSALLLNQVDHSLRQAAQGMIRVAKINSTGGVSFPIPASMQLTANVYFQYWDRNGQLQTISPGIRDLHQALDPLAVNASLSIIHEVTVENEHMRVLTVPLNVGSRPMGVLQAATNLVLIDSIRQDLLNVLGVLTLVSMAVAGLTTWIFTGQALAPLENVTETAEQIVRADDLSRRIPYNGPPSDEIGTLIRSFNRTLGRLETLFLSQQRFLADVSHELRTPLTVIKGSVDLVRKFGPDNESLDSIVAEADRLTRLVGDLLLLAQAESGKLPLNLASVQLDVLITDLFQEMGVLAGEKVHLKLTDIDQVRVQGDRDRLKQVFINLISNAIQYTPMGGDVYLSLSKSDEMARVVVRDTGPGIPSKDLPHIFDRFYRGEKSRTRSTKSGGFGLGLSIAYWIVDHHGGRIEADSQEGQGTTFAVYLPLLG